MAAALTVALAPVPATSIGHYDVSLSRYTSSTLSLHNVKDSFAFLPIYQATSYMFNLADRLKIHRTNLKVKQEEKGIPIVLGTRKKKHSRASKA
ncbi:hypothetical protein GKQ23_15635 [Erwinia sp. E602]|uniref:hypothetical protein n=1 Tax=Erwinia sp. E602 TaxID=2675378 RepID=UPI001BA47003|nr:hypothetical protein [Erwinia sp. E602]QUG76345.1 hypothetical protein GKQ23_15635 [Erwinia sp. E602]